VPQKPGSAALPFFGVVPALLDAQSGAELSGEAEGVLCIKAAWPGAARTIYGDAQRFEEVYYKPFPGYYFTSDGARRCVRCSLALAYLTSSLAATRMATIGSRGGWTT